MPVMKVKKVMVYWDRDSDPSNPGWLLRWTGEDVDNGLYPGDTEDVSLDAQGEDRADLARAEAARYLGWDKWTMGVRVEPTGDAIYHLIPKPQCEVCAERGLLSPTIHDGYDLCGDCIAENEAKRHRELEG